MEFASIVPLLVILLACLVVAFLIRRNTPRDNFESEYFIAGRRLGPFVLVMTTIATFGSITAFVGMPGQAWEYGFGWVYMSCAQIVSLILLFGVMGKKLALISRKIHAVSIVDIINVRYKSSFLTLILSIALIVFFLELIVAQFVGAALILEAATGFSYEAGLIVIAAITALYTAIGGFRGVAFTDTICGIIMIISALILGGTVLAVGGGYENIMQTISQTKPAMLDIHAGGQIDVGLFVTQFLIMGLLVFAMPQTAVRCLSFKSTRSLRHALWIGTFLVGFLLVGLTALGALSYAVFPDALNEYGSNIDDVIPLLITHILPPWLVGLVILGPIAAAISTVSSLLISSSVDVVRAISANSTLLKKRQLNPKGIRFNAQIASLLLSGIAVLIATVPPDLIWHMSMSAFGGIEVSFCWVFLLGIFWRRANKVGAVLSIISGVLTYLIASPFNSTLFGDFGEIVFALGISLAFMVFGSLFFRVKEDPQVDEVFFPQFAPPTTAKILEIKDDQDMLEKLQAVPVDALEDSGQIPRVDER